MVVTEFLTKIIGFIFNDSEEDLVGPFLNRGDISQFGFYIQSIYFCEDEFACLN